MFEPNNFKEDDPAYELGDLQCSVETNETGIYVHESPTEERVYVVQWTDYVANEWRVRCSTLPDAVAYASLIVYCVEHDVFVTDDARVALLTQIFHESATT